jgi:TP901 family phage tail tape measure protein
MAAAGAAIGATLFAAGRDAIAFESALTKSVTQIGVSRAEMDLMGESALRLTDAGRGPIELAESLFFVQSAGQRGSEALATVEASSKASAIGLGDTATVADLATSAMNAYGSETLDAAQATDIMLGAVREGKTSAEELAGSLGQVLPIASEMGVTFDEVGAAVAAMTRTGTNASTSVTQLRAILTSLLNPAQQSEEAMSELGISSQVLRDVIQQDGLWAAMQLLRDSIGGNDAALGKILPNVRALAGFLDLTGANAAENEQIFARMTDTVGLTDDAFDEWSKTTEASQARFSASMEAARISLGENLLPVLRFFLDTGASIANTFTDLSGPTQTFTAFAAAALAVVLTLGGGFLILAPRIVATRAALATLAATAPRATTALTLMGRAAGASLGALAILAIAAEKFGRSSGDLALGVNELAESFERLEQGEVDKNLERIRQAFDDMDNTVTLLSVTFATDFSNGFGSGTKRSNEMKDAIQSLDSAMAQMVTSGDIESTEDAISLLAEATGRSEEEMEGLIENMPLLRDAIAGAGDEAGTAEAEFDLLEDELGELEEQTSAADERLQAYLDTIRGATDPVFALLDAVLAVEEADRAGEDALRDLRRAQEDLDETRGDSEASARDLEDAERAVEDAERAVEDAAVDEARALADLEEQALNSEISFEDFEAKLKTWVEQGKLTKEEAEDIRDRVKEAREEAEDFKDDYVATFKQEGIDRVNEKMQALEEGLRGFPTEIETKINAVVSGIKSAFAGGGPVIGAGTGTSDSIDARLSNGEHVWTAAEVAAAGGHMRVMAMRQAALAQGGPLTSVTVKATSNDFDFTDFLDDASSDIANRHGASGRVLPPGSYRIGRGSAGHGYGALDLPAPTGTPVFSVATGVVSRALRLGYSYGVHAFINHAGERQSRYAHLSALAVGAGDVVRAGQMIGRVGSTGNSTGPHLHYEDLIGGVRRRPENLGIFDSGGILPSGGAAINLSGHPELVLGPTDTANIMRPLRGSAHGGSSSANPIASNTMPDRFVATATIDLGEGITRRVDLAFERHDGEILNAISTGVGRAL